MRTILVAPISTTLISLQMGQKSQRRVMMDTSESGTPRLGKTRAQLSPSQAEELENYRGPLMAVSLA